MFTFSIDTQTELRLLETRHAPELFKLTDQSRQHIREWLPWVDMINSPADSGKFIDLALEQFRQNNGFQAGIWYRGELAGIIGLHQISWTNKSTTFGYWLGEQFQGQGLMTAACRAIIAYCFEELHLNRVEIRAAAENKKSQAIPERLGFTKEGRLRQAEWLHDRFADHYVYSLLKDEFRSASS
ncbi:GNAT family N-acetyltransferase [Planococcus lenghuensis]|uniref:Alanine acetyltransferase n=1 Tax=Planococcus lenghuensis TaxID=2213202 RepID=A0A1Q2KWI9_9BACL|nr:GNAT family protein [Planococcus lenghuensis]AQQ52549.1 alanine acetyltransferase [Planococcus lenghuensis]